MADEIQARGSASNNGANSNGPRESQCGERHTWEVLRLTLVSRLHVAASLARRLRRARDSKCVSYFSNDHARSGGPRFACAAGGERRLEDCDLAFFPFKENAVVCDAHNGLFLCHSAGAAAAAALRFFVVDPPRRWRRCEMTLVITADDRTIEIPLRGNMTLVQNSSGQASPPQAVTVGGNAVTNEGQVAPTPRSQEEEDRKYLDNMQGWLVTVATLFVGIAYQAAMQPPPWMPKTQDWSRVIFHKERYLDMSPDERNLVKRANNYQIFNTVTFSSALTMVVLLLVLGKFSARRVLLGARFLVAVISFCLVANFMNGITCYRNASLMFWVFGAFCAFYAAYLLDVLPILMAWATRSARNTAGPGTSHDQQHAQPAETQLHIQDTHPASN
ncbi:hypothetical protein ACP4OV_006758 [Aristida adscensionis]